MACGGPCDRFKPHLLQSGGPAISTQNRLVLGTQAFIISQIQVDGIQDISLEISYIGRGQSPGIFAIGFGFDKLRDFNFALFILTFTGFTLGLAYHFAQSDQIPEFNFIKFSETTSNNLIHTPVNYQRLKAIIGISF